MSGSAIPARAGGHGPLALPPRAAIAFSGGLDSRLLCHEALSQGVDVLALHAAGPHVLPRETAGARAFANAVGLRLVVLDFDPLPVPEVAVTSRERCYGCKKALLAAMRDTLDALGEGDRTLCDGTNADDTAVFRPGLRALHEAGARSPLAEAGWTKARIRARAREVGLPLPAGRSRPCLLTRYAYGLTPDRESLATLARVESELLDLPTPPGPDGQIPDFRVRLTPAPVLQVAGADPAWIEAAAACLERHGLAPFTLLTGDHVSGFYDQGAQVPASGAKNP